MEKLKNAREEHNLSQEDVAKILGIKRCTYTSYETKRDAFPIKHLNTLCNYFNISIDYAMGLTKIKQYENSRKDIDIKKASIRLKELRLDSKLTQVKMAKLLNTSRSTWTGYEYGNYQISTLLLYDICYKFKYSMDYVLGKIDENKLKEK